MALWMERPLTGTEEAGAAYRPDIDGLRAVAVVSVLLFHAGFTSFRGGFTGVDVFFAISGFLIGGHIYAEEMAGRFSFLGFYQKRARRILPALYLVIVSVLVLGSLLLSPIELKRSATESVGALLSGSNLLYWKSIDYFAVAADQRTLLMTWSLGVEEQFYIVVPLLMIFALRLRLRLVPVLVMLTGMSLLIATYQVTHAPAQAFYLLPSRAWELLGGVLLAVVVSSSGKRLVISKSLQNIFGTLGLLLVLLPIFLLARSTPYPGIDAAPSILGSLLVLVAPRAAVNRLVLSTKPLRLLGKISYSLYLWHWPLLTFTRIVLGGAPSHIQATAVLMASFVLSLASYQWIEQPFRRSQKPSRELLLRYVAVTAALLVACFGIRVSYGMAFRAPELAAEEKYAAVTDDPCDVPAPNDRPNLSSSCSETTGRPALVLWGDSHAAALAPAMRVKAHDAGYDFIEAAKSSCPPLWNAGRYLREDPDFSARCMLFNDEIMRRILADRRIQVVVLAAYWKATLVDPYKTGTGWLVSGRPTVSTLPSIDASEQLLFSRLTATTMALRLAGRRVILLQDSPSFVTEPLWRIRTTGLPVRRWVLLRLHPHESIDPGSDVDAEAMADDVTRSIISTAATSTPFDLEYSLCSSPVACRYRDGNHIFYQDNQHLTFLGAQTALNRLMLPTVQR